MGTKRSSSGSGSASKRFKSGYPVGSSTQVATGPPTLIRKLRYSDTVTASPSTSASNYFFSANGCYDPDITGTGHQPMGFDQYMLLYNHFKVTSSKITVSFVSPATDTQADNVICAIYLDDSTNVVTNIHSAIEQGTTVWKAVAAKSVKPTVLAKKFNSNKFFYNKKNSSDLVGNSGFNPTEGAFFNVLVGPMNPVDNPTDFRMLITIDYIVQFSERATLPSS